MEKHPHYVKARDDQRRDGQNHRVGAECGEFVGRPLQQRESQKGKEQSDGQAAGVAHEYFLFAFGASEYVVVEKLYQHSEAGERQHGEDRLADHQERCAVDDERRARKPGCEAVDSVDEVDGVDHIYHDKYRQRNAEPWRDMTQADDAVEVVDIHSGSDEQHGAEYLHDKLGAVAHSDQVVGHSGEVHEQQRAQSERYGLGVDAHHVFHVGVAHEYRHAEKQRHAEQDHRREGYAAKAGHGAAVDLALVGHVEQFATVRHQKNLRNQYSRKEDAQQRRQEAADNPGGHISV